MTDTDDNNKGGSKDDIGTPGDHDQPYEFGHRPSLKNPRGLTTHEMVGLLKLRASPEAWVRTIQENKKERENDIS